MVITTEIIASFTREEDGVTVFVTRGARGYNISLKDDDSDNFLTVVLIYKDLTEALIKAKSIVAGE